MSFASAPVDIRQKAMGIAAAFHDDEHILAGAIAAALLRERTRCANIAAPLPIEPDESDYEKQAHDIRSVIHTAILNGEGA